MKPIKTKNLVFNEKYDRNEESGTINLKIIIHYSNTFAQETTLSEVRSHLMKSLNSFLSNQRKINQRLTSKKSHPLQFLTCFLPIIRGQIPV